MPTFTPGPSTFTLKAKTSATTTSVNFNPGGNNYGAVRLYISAQTSPAMYNIGKGATTATVSSIPLPTGVLEYIETGNADTIALYNPTGSATMYVNYGVLNK